MANQVNNYFVTVPEKLTKKIGQANNIYQDYLKKPNEHSMYLTEIEPDEIKTQIQNLNNKISANSEYLRNISKFSENCR